MEISEYGQIVGDSNLVENLWRCSDMVSTKAILASIMIVVLAANIVSGATPLPNMALNKQPVTARTDITVPAINLNGINFGQAAPGNSWPVNLTVNVTQMGNGICNLNASNFKLDTITVPPNGSAVVIKSVTLAPHPNFMYGSSPCSYWVLVVPDNNHGRQNTWANGNYTLRLDYLNGGKQLAKSKVFDLFDEITFQRAVAKSGIQDQARRGLPLHK